MEQCYWCAGYEISAMELGATIQFSCSAVFEGSNSCFMRTNKNACNQLFNSNIVRVITNAMKQCATGFTHSLHPSDCSYILSSLHPSDWRRCLPSNWMDDWARQRLLSFTSKQKEETGRFNGIVQFHCPLCCTAHSHKQKVWSQYYMHVGTRVATCLISGLGPSIQHH